MVLTANDVSFEPRNMYHNDSATRNDIIARVVNNAPADATYAIVV